MVAAIALIAAAITAHVPRGHGIAAVTLSTAVLLLMTLYVLVSEANSRLPGDSVVAWWVRLAIPTLGLVAVLKPIADSHFAPLDVATVIAAAVVVSAAAITVATSSGAKWESAIGLRTATSPNVGIARRTHHATTTLSPGSREFASETSTYSVINSNTAVLRVTAATGSPR
ncbi:hypothetical protein MAHJHV63_54840 [Mycobacterium avium subsp. hominissuis]